MPRRTKIRSLRNIDYTDRELLHVIASVSDNEGRALAQDVAEQLGIRANGKRKGRGTAGTVTSRMSWMKRYGFLDRIDPRSYGGRLHDPPLWIITPMGHQLMAGKLNRSVEQAIERMEPGAQVLMMRQLTQRAYIEAPYEVATAVRREYLHNAARRTR